MSSRSFARHAMSLCAVGAERVGNTVERAHQEIDISGEPRLGPILERAKRADQHRLRAELSEATFELEPVIRGLGHDDATLLRWQAQAVRDLDAVVLTHSHERHETS